MRGLNTKRATLVAALFWLLVAPVVHSVIADWYNEHQARDVLISCLKTVSGINNNSQCYGIYNALQSQATPYPTFLVGHAIAVGFLLISGSILYVGVRWIRAGAKSD